MEPELTKSGAKIEKSTLNRPKWLPNGSQDPFTQNPPKIFSNFGVSSGIPKSTKNRSLAPNEVPGGDVLSIRVAKIVIFTFGLNFVSIFNQFLMEKSMHLFKAARDLFNLSTP